MNAFFVKSLRGVAAVAVAVLVVPQAALFAQEGASPDVTPRIYIPLVAGGVGQQADGSTHAVSEEEAAAADAYWTPERKAAAETAAATLMAANAIPEGEAQEAMVNVAAIHGPEGAPGSAAGGLPDPAADAEAQRDFPEAWAAIAAAATSGDTEPAALDSMAPDAMDGSANTFSWWPGNYHTEMWRGSPYRTVGKLYVTHWNGSSITCTAAVISSRNIVATSASCIYDTVANRWHRNIVFVPAARASTEPYGRFQASYLAVAPAYVAATSWSAGLGSDVGLVRLYNNSAGRPVTYYTGYLARTWNNSYVRNLVEIGYSSHYSSLYTSVSTAESYVNRTDVLAFGSPFRWPAWGSPLMLNFMPYRSGTISGIHSGLLGASNTGVGPRFTTSNLVTPCANIGGC